MKVNKLINTNFVAISIMYTYFLIHIFYFSIFNSMLPKEIAYTFKYFKYFSTDTGHWFISLIIWSFVKSNNERKLYDFFCFHCFKKIFWIENWYLFRLAWFLYESFISCFYTWHFIFVIWFVNIFAWYSKVIPFFILFNPIWSLIYFL